jgi:hypothetical protein
MQINVLIPPHGIVQSKSLLLKAMQGGVGDQMSGIPIAAIPEFLPII